MSLAAILLILKRLWYLVLDHWKIFAGIVAVIALAIFLNRACGHRAAKLNEAEIIAAQQAIEKKDSETLRQILVAADTREAAIDINVANSKAAVVNAMVDAKKKYAAMSDEELAREIEARK